MKAKANEKAVLVTTAHKGVFFGYATDMTKETIKLRGARLCVYWSSDLRGFMGLAVTGPNGNCKIGPAADIEALYGVTSITLVSPEAESKWINAKW